MPLQTVRFFFGRLNLNAMYTNKKAYLLEGLQAGRSLVSRGSAWGFFEIAEISVEGADYIYGFLGKYKPLDEEEIAVPETSQIEDQSISNRIAAKSRFLLHVSSGLIAYHPVSSQISELQFRNNFSKVLQEGHDNLFIQASIELVQEEFQLLNILPNFERIFEFSVSLHPSNPSSSDNWDAIDNRIKELNGIQYQEKIEAKLQGDGLQIANDKETRSKIAMAEDGYGKAQVTGILDGVMRTVSTSENPITVMAPNDEHDIDGVIRVVTYTFARIFGRFNKND